MKKTAITVSALLFMVFSTGPWAQKLPEGINPGAATPGPSSSPTIVPGSGYQKFLSLLNKSTPKPVAPTPAASSFEPMFQIKGPDLRSNFWEDRETAGRTLVLQGELMKRMGEVLVEQGEAMLQESKAPAQQD